MGVFRRGRLAAIGAVAGVGLMMVGTLPVSAQAAGGGVFQGNGTLTTGSLFVAPTPVAFSVPGALTGAAVVNGAPVVITDSCTFTGSSSNPLGGDNLAFGAGNVSGSCSGSLVITFSGTYVRVGAAVGVEGSGTAGTVAGNVVAECAFATTQAPPVTNFIVVCAAEAAGP